MRYLAAPMLAVLGLAAATPAALAQAIRIDIADPTAAPGRSTTITLSASYPAGDYALAGIATEIYFPVIQGSISDLSLIAPMDGPGTSAGVYTGDAVEGIIAGQLNFPPAFIFADPTNPIAFFSMTFTADAVLTPYDILEVRTRTTRFDVYVDRDSARSESRLDGLIEGHAIMSIPSPGGVAVLGLGLLAARRRR